MFARINANHQQLAYVTNDLDQAVALFEREYQIPGFFVFTNTETIAVSGDDPHLRIALANVNGVEIELIEPVGGGDAMFSEVLPKTPGLHVIFHHVATRIFGSIENWDAYVASIDTEAHKIVYRGELGDMLRFLYTDERAHIGHYVEHVWMSTDLLEQMHAAVPRFPK
jgi:hypothetical protein